MAVEQPTHSLSVEQLLELAAESRAQEKRAALKLDGLLRLAFFALSAMFALSAVLAGRPFRTS